MNPAFHLICGITLCDYDLMIGCQSIRLCMPITMALQPHSVAFSQSAQRILFLSGLYSNNRVLQMFSVHFKNITVSSILRLQKHASSSGISIFSMLIYYILSREPQSDLQDTCTKPTPTLAVAVQSENHTKHINTQYICTDCYII